MFYVTISSHGQYTNGIFGRDKYIYIFFLGGGAQLINWVTCPIRQLAPKVILRVKEISYFHN